MIKLGSRVRDAITGFEGIAIARTEWIYGCSRIGVEATKLDEKGKPADAQWFDEQRIELVKEQAPPLSAQSDAPTGGPRSDPAPHQGP